MSLTEHDQQKCTEQAIKQNTRGVCLSIERPSQFVVLTANSFALFQLRLAPPRQPKMAAAAGLQMQLRSYFR